ncbi:nidogen-1-like [Synchiropus picturatus]
MMSRSCAWLWFWLSLGPQSFSLLPVLAHPPLQINQLFRFGAEVGDQQLQPGSDSTAEVPLNGSLLMFREEHDRVFINTNGFVSLVKPPTEDQYLGKTPAGLKLVAALLGDLVSDGQGAVFFREDSSPAVLNLTAEHVRRAFPLEDDVVPERVLIVTWRNMVARGAADLRGDHVYQRNTFQLILASTASSSYAVLMYPQDGLQFLSTMIAGETKTLQAGFDEGQVKRWWEWSYSQGEHLEMTSAEEESVRDLARKSNAGRAGVWVYQIGASSFSGIRSGVTALTEEVTSTSPPATMLPRQPDQQQDVTTHPTAHPTLTQGAEAPTPMLPGESEHHNFTADNQTESSEPLHPDTQDSDRSPTTETPQSESYYTNQTLFVERNSTESTGPNQTESIGSNQSETTDPNQLETPAPIQPDQLQTPDPGHPDQLETTDPDQLETTDPDQLENPDLPDQLETPDPDQPDQLVTPDPDQPDQLETTDPDQLENLDVPDQLEIPEPGQPDQLLTAAPDLPGQSVTTGPTQLEPPDSSTPVPRATEQPDSRDSNPAETKNQTETQHTSHEPSEPELPEPRKPSIANEPRYADPGLVPPLPPHSGPQHPQIIVVDEDLDVDVFSYNLDTCAHGRHRCSAFAECRDYSEGYCCHCRPGYYGDGKDCVGEGRPQRMTGKVWGQVYVGDASRPVTLNNSDLHSYIVANDGRAYVAISNINRDLGPAMQPLSSVGGVIGWAFALEQPQAQNGFRLIGGVFTRQAEVIFQPGNERLTIRQEFSGLDEHEHLVVSTRLEGRVPDISPGSSVHILPYKEIYQYDQNLISSSSNRDYTINSAEGGVESRSFQWRQTISFQTCQHQRPGGASPSTQQLSVDQIFVMYDSENRLIRYATTNKIGPLHGGAPEQNPCFTGRHGCDINAMCHPGDGVQFRCECTAGFHGDGRYCHDVDECSTLTDACGSNSVCVNQPGSFGCRCLPGFTMEPHSRACVAQHRPLDHCAAGSHSCDIPERARCSYVGGSAFVCSCLPGFHGDGHQCHDVNECAQVRCHQDATCTNTPGSFSCQCRAGFHGDGLQCAPTEREPTLCERHRLSAEESGAAASSSGFFSFFRPRPAAAPYIPQCDQHGGFEPTQCHAAVGQCWCVDANGQEIPDTRTSSGHSAMCIDQTVTAPPLGPTPRPDVNPSGPGSHLLFAQSGRIEQIPLQGHGLKTELAKTLLHVPDRVVIAVAYDCVEKMVYWSDITAPSISRASIGGGTIVPVITKALQSPEGIAVDHVSRLLFWTDSMKDTVEVSQLDGSNRRVLFDTDLVNPRPIATNPTYGQLFWADWDRDGPKIEMSNMDGTDRTLLVSQDLSLPNGLTFDPDTQQLCWADAGVRRLECLDPHRKLRRTILEGVHYPFGLAQIGGQLIYTDWRREAVVGVDVRQQKETEEFLPQRRSRLYGIAVAPAECRRAYNYCQNNGGCSHLCLPKPGGFSCRCPDDAGDLCVERNP